MPNNNFDHLNKRGIEETLSLRHFFEVKLLVVPFYNFMKNRIVRPAGLYDHLALGFSSASPSRYLCYLLEGPLARSKIREVKNAVCVHDPHHRHFVKIQALGDHLRPHQNINVASAEIFQYSLVSIFTSCCV